MLFSAYPFKETTKPMRFPSTGMEKEDSRIARKLSQNAVDRVSGLRFPRLLKAYLAEVYLGVFNARVSKGALMYRANNGAMAELKAAIKNTKAALEGWALSPDVAYSKTMRESLVMKLSAQNMAVIQGLEKAPISYTEKLKQAAYSCVDNLVFAGIDAPAIPKDEQQLESFLLRMMCEKYLGRKLEAKAAQMREYVEIYCGRVGTHNPYMSKRGVAEYRRAKQQSKDFLESFLLVNDELEQECSLSEASKAGVSNPEIRRVELMVRAKGLEEVAIAQGMSGNMLTLTAPRCYHRKSDNYNGATPRQTQRYLVDCWALARAKLAKANIEFLGLRTAEPHKSGTPHWHMLFFVKPEREKEALEIIKGEFCRKDFEEIKDNQKPRFDAVKIDSKKGSAVGYVAKYISKNIDGHGLEGELDRETNTQVSENVERVAGWSSLWRVRQFQFFGLAPVGIWREVRKIQEKTDSKILNDVMAAAAKHGETASYATYHELSEKLTLIKVDEKGEEYADSVKRVVGVACEGVEVITRIGKWVKEALTDARRAAIEKHGSAFTWTRLNKCNYLTGDVSEGSTAVPKVRIEFDSFSPLGRKVGVI